MATPGTHSAAGFAATPKSASRRSSRRSWFDTPPATPLDIAVERQPMKTMNSRRKRRSDDDVETLVLSHFTKPPRISFGKVIVGRSKTRVLLMQNPAEYEQEVVIERFPYKKYFNVDQSHFIVQPEEVVSLTLTWTPQDAGGCREMILFHVNDVYRLQAYMFGTADDPKPVRKSRKGMLGTRQKQPLTSVVQTKSLKSIHDNYSPRKSEETRELRSHARPSGLMLHMDQENLCPGGELEEHSPQTPPPLESTAICKGDERHEQKVMDRRKSGFLSPTLSKMSPIPLTADNNNGCIVESYLSTTTGCQSSMNGGIGGERGPLKNVTGNGNKGQGRNSRESDRDKPDMPQLKKNFGRNVSIEAEKPRVHVSPNSFLNDSIAGKTTASTEAEVGQVRASSHVARVSEKVTVSPNSFVQNMGNKQSVPFPQRSSIPSPSAVLNNSIPHTIMMKQLEDVRKSLHDGSFHESPVLSTGAKIQAKPVPRSHLPGKVTDRLSQLAQPKTRKIIIHAQQPGIPGKKEKFLQRKLHEKACFAKITDVPSPRRKTFLITKKQQGKKTSPLKNRLQNGKCGRKGMEQRELLSSRCSSGVLKKPTADTEQAQVNVVRVDSQTVMKHCKMKEQVFPEHGKMHSVVPDDLHNEGITQDDVTTDRRRSMWKSPAVAGFVSPVIAVQSDCDSTGDERQMLGNVHSQMIRAEDHCHPTQQAWSQQVTLTAETDGDITKAVSQEREDKGRRSLGRRLFPGVISDDLNLSKDFRPLWSGSATVTKECPSSITPPFPGSANSSKKLFPEISTSAVWSMDTKPTPEAVSQNKEGVVDAKADLMKTGEIVGTIQANNRPKRGTKEKEAARETAKSVEIVDMSLESRHSLKGQVDRSLSKSDMQKAEIVDMALTDSQLQRGKPGQLFDDLQNTQEKSRHENMHLQGKRFNSFEWGSPQQLPQNPGSEMNRRSTLTVTKSRPSQALLDACNSGSTGTGPDRNVATNAQDNTIEMQGNENDSDELWRSETIIIETKNNNVVSFSVHREVLTPSELPSSPSSENSRRSTHAVKNPVVLKRDSLIPKNLFGSVPKSKMLSENGEMNDPKCVSETWGMVLKDKEQSHDVRQKSEMEETHEMDHIGQGIVTSVSDDSPLLDVYTDRVEHRISHQRDRIDRPGLCQPQPALDSSVSSQELSTDSLEAEKKANTDVRRTKEDGICSVRDTDVCGDVLKQDGCMSLKDGRECIANANSDVIDANENGVSRQFITQQSSCSEMHMLEQSGAKAATSQHTYSHHFKTQNTSKLLSKDKARVPRKIEPKESLSQEDATESFTEITPCLSATSVESKESVFEASGQYSVDYPVPPSPNSLARETSAKPITSSNIVKEALQKKGAKSEKTAESSSSATLSQDKKITPSHEGVLRRSLSAGYHSSIIQPSQAGKLAAPTFREMNLSHQKARTASVLVPKGQGLPKARSQGSLNRRSKPVELQSSTCAGQQTEQRLSRKRSSPEAGLKAPHSKRVELERHSTGRRTQQAMSSRGITPAQPKLRRAAKPSTRVALSKLILVKKSKTALPKHPLPFAAKNMYYDERWQDKQERGFVHWLNFVLTPADEYVLATTKTKVDARTIAFDGTPHQVAPRLAPTKEILSFRAYTARRRLNHLRRASCRLFQSEAVVRVVCRLELEVEQRRLAVRTDRMIHADIGLKQKILDLLLSYNPLWLRIGLETVYGEVLPIQTNSDVVGISRFVLTRLLTSPDISAHYAHPTVPHLYHDGYADAVAQHMLKKFLVLVYFLDNAKQSRLITHDPCLFCKDAEIKSTKDLLIQFSRDFLSGEGDITKHLAYMGYIVWHVQTPIDEFDYAVANLCTDLRDGLRLGRVVTLLSGDWTFAASLRAPAISRLQKIHNVELVFKQLTQRGLDLHDNKGAIMNPRDIVDGHREKTLAFLWKLIFHFQTVATLNEQELQEEVNILERTLRVKVCMQRLLGHPQSLQHCAARRDSGGPSAVMDNPMLQLLLKWCRTVCLHYGVKVENFTVSFSDGRALCCLLHHYHPALLPLENIHFRTSQSMQEDAENAGEGTGEDDSELSQDWGVNPLGGGELDQSLFDTLLVNEKENFRILYEKVSELGGIPLMLKAADMSNTIPDERVVVTYVSYLCARLLDLREETRAARIIQLAWRRLCLRRSAHLRQKKIAACLVIQRAWRQHTVAMMTRKQEAAAVCLQASWRGHQARRRVALLRQAKISSAMHKAATQIQTCVRCFLTRRHYQRQHCAAITIQSWFRVHCAQLAFVRQQQACIVIQRRFRAHMEGAAVRQEFASKKCSAVILQRAFRLRQLRRMENRNRAACLLQSAWRGRKCRGELLRQGQAAVMIQSWWRGNHAQTQFLKMRTACTIIQQQFRAARLGAEVRQHFLRLQWAAVTLQKHVRGSRQQRQFRHLKNSALTLQKNFKGYKCRVKFQALRLATIIIQRAVQSHQARTAARRNFVTMKQAALTIQTWYRQQTRRQALKREEAATLIQAYVRRHLAGREVSVLRAALRREAAVITIQNFCRTALARRKFQAFQLGVRKNRAAVKIQAGFRGFIARRQVQLLRHEARREQACITIQSAYRCCRAVRQFRIFQAAARLEQAAMKIQSAIRKYLAVKKLKAFQLKAKREWAAVRIQAAWRRYIAVKELRILQLEARRRSAAVKIQAAYRRHLALRQLKRLHQAAKQKEAAISIQCAYRRHVAVRQLKCLQKEAKRQAAAIRIQSSYRRHLAIRELRAIQLAAKREASAVRIQSAYRGHVSRRYVHRLKEAARQELAAKRIQAYIRGCLQRRHYLKMQRSVLLLQSHVRGYRARKNYRQMKEVLLILAEYHQTQERFKAVIGEYHQQWKAAVTAQSAWRGWRHRHKFLTTKSSICKLQAAVRGHAQRKKYLLLRRSATVIQRWFRAHTAGRVTRLKYQLMLGAAVIIQSSWKMYIIRSYYLQLRARVICAQAQCRKFLARTKFQRQQRAAICIQRHYRAWAYSQKVQKEYQKSRHAIVRLQALFRAKQQRECLHRLRQSCITIQSAVRGWLAQRSYQNQRQSAVVLQRQWRACLQGRKDRKRYMETRAALIIIQSHAQGYLARKHIHHIKQAASTIQKHYRGYQRRCQFLRYRKAAVTLQQHIRAFLVAQQQRKDLALAQQACIRIQSAYRGHVTRQHYLRCRQHVVRLQAMVRGQQQRRRYLALYRATLWCQSHYRAKCLGHVFRTAFLLIRCAAVIIQKHVRGHRSRQKYQMERSSIVLLQAHVRGWLQRQELNQQRQAVLVLQRRWRMKKEGEMKRQNFLHTRCAAITIQRSWRLVQQARLQNTHSAATVIQKHVRRHLAQIRFRSEVMRITQTQAVVKGFLLRRAMSKRLCAVKLIQRRWKETLLARHCRRNFLLMVGSAVMIQSVFRGHRIRAYFTMALKRIVLLQAVFRGYLQRRKYLQLQNTVLSLQRRVRNIITCRRERNHFLQQRNAVVCIQAAFRHWQRRCKDKKTRAATCLQSYFRMLSVRKHFHRRRTAAIVLQSALRGHQARQSLHQKKAAIVLIQRRVRFYLLVRSLRFKVHRRRQATVTIQRAFRKYLARVQSRKSHAAIRIQVAFRGFVQRQQFQRQKQAALTLQCGLRGWRDRRRVREMRNTVEAALLIQRHFRAWKQKKEEEERRLQREEYLQRFTRMAKRHLAVVRIQRRYRQVMLMRQARQQLHCVIVLQRRVRGFLQRRWFLRVRQETQEMQARQERAARVIQSAVRSWRVQREERRRIQLITKVQAIWRGRCLRRGLKNKKIAKARRRVQEANEKATQEKTLGHRTASALDFLLHYKQLAYILDALMHLDVVTRLSSVCCERLVEVNAVGAIFRLILSCNRSLPHMELIKYSVSVLLNLAKYEKTAHAVYEADGSVTTLVDLMSIYREKGGAIFTKTCMLLALLGSDPQRKAEMCSDKRLVGKLQSIHVLVLRKHRMQMAHARQVAARASLNATLPSRLLHGPRAARVQPAWVLRRDSLHDIEDPLAALSFVLDALHIGPK